ncbi:MAG TPA: hypothetical protein VKC90_14815 [Chitinophagaceae bacterium]|nr:hypothetical protein [Chitinophagaceae bacterium]
MPAFITPVPQYAGEYPQFFTASIKGWYKLLEHDKYKDIIITSLRFLIKSKNVTVIRYV